MALLALMGCKNSPSTTASGYDLRIDTAFNAMPIATRHLLIVITPAPSTTPAPAGSVIVVNGTMSMSSGAAFTTVPTATGGNWVCSGSWAAFTCTTTLSAPMNNEAVQLFTSYSPPPPNTTITYNATVSMPGNTDPDPTNNVRNITQNMN